MKLSNSLKLDAKAFQKGYDYENNLERNAEKAKALEEKLLEVAYELQRMIGNEKCRLTSLDKPDNLNFELVYEAYALANGKFKLYSEENNNETK